MKFNLFSRTVLAVSILLVYTACKDNNEVKLASLNVTVQIHDSFSGLSVENLYVYTTSTANGGVDSALTDTSGVALFTNMAPGTYNVTANMKLTPEEASTSSGYYEELTLGCEEKVELFADIESPCSLVLDGSPSNPIVINEVFFNGTMTDWLFYKTQFIELYNNSKDVSYADGIYVAYLAPNKNGSSSSDVPTTLNLTQTIYAQKIMRVPGTGNDYPIQPGETLLIAINAVNYSNGDTSTNPDLSQADFDTYATTWMEGQERDGSTDDIDNIDVPNMECIYINQTYGYYLIDPTAPSIAIFRNDNFTITEVTDPAATEPITLSDKYAVIDVEDILDGVDVMFNADMRDYKRLPSSIDVGFSYINAFFSGKSIRRKEAKIIGNRRVVMDTNNSTSDFEVIDTPTPGEF